MLYVPSSDLSDEARTFDFAVASLMEELEATNYYNQRAVVATDDSLKEIMIHNRNEEIEHCAMLIEWFRRNSPEFEEQLRLYLFTDAPITEVEEMAMMGGGTPGKAPDGVSLGLGSLRRKRA